MVVEAARTPASTPAGTWTNVLTFALDGEQVTIQEPDLLLRSGVPLTAQTIEDHFDGNLCRCTGMRPILKAMQTFAGTIPPAAPTPPAPPTPQPLYFTGSDHSSYRPLTIGDLRSILFAACDATPGPEA